MEAGKNTKTFGIPISTMSEPGKHTIGMTLMTTTWDMGMDIIQAEISNTRCGHNKTFVIA